MPADSSASVPANPRVGMLAVVRRRRGVISDVCLFAGEHGTTHLVRIDSKDEFRPHSEELLWELEPGRRLLEPSERSRADDAPMPPAAFDALVRATRWGGDSSLSRH